MPPRLKNTQTPRRQAQPDKRHPHQPLPIIAPPVPRVLGGESSGLLDGPAGGADESAGGAGNERAEVSC
eukprot:1146741-Pelagomonas_calceolata.AAC.1